MESRSIAPSETGSLRAGDRADTAKAAELFAEWSASLSGATRRNYSNDLAAFAAHLGVPDRRQAAVALCTSPPLDARSLVLRFKTARRDAGEAPGTINRRLSALRSLYRHVTGVPLVIPSMKAVPRRRVHRGHGSLVASLLAAAAAGIGIKALRDVALVATLHDSGLRRAEVASLRVCDLDLEARVAHVIAKGRQGEREAVDLSAPAVEALKAYLTARGVLPPDSPVFASCDRARKGNGALTADGIHAILGALSERVGLSHPLAPHDLRRSGARSLAKAGADAETLRRWGRWADYRTPARYVGEVAEKGREAVDLLARLRQAAG